jgi:hypothetical protein
MNQDRHYPTWTSVHGRTDIRRTGPSWLVFAGVRPWILRVFDHRVDFGGIDEPKSPRRGHEPDVWMRRIKPDRQDLQNP